MADNSSFWFRLMKVALIVMHTLVATGLTLLIMMAFFGPHGNMGIGFVILFIEANSWLGIIGVYRESRGLLVTTGTVTLFMLLLAVFTVNDRQNTTFPFIYFLTIVGLSYALSDMIRTRGQSSESVDSEAHMGHEIRRQAYPTAVPFTALVVGPAMQSNLPSRTVPVYATPDPPIVQFNDSPPPYDDCPPPKYEDAIKETK